MTNTTSDAMKYFRNLTFIVKCAVVCCVMPIASGCSHSPLPAGKYSGTIVTWNVSNQFRLDLQTGSWRQHSWGNPFSPDILCQAAGDTIMVVNTTWIIGSENREYPTHYTSNPIHKYVLFDSTFKFVKSIGDISFFCSSLDYDPDNKTFFYGGIFQNVKGGFLLDSSFNLIRKLTAIPEEFGLRENNLFVSEDKIVMSSFGRAGGTYIYDLNTDEMTRIGDYKSILSVTPDKNHILMAEGDFGQAPLSLAIYDIHGQKIQILPIDDYEAGRVCFSPSGKQLAYPVSTGILHMNSRVQIYDLETQETFLTSEGGGGHSLLWTAKRMPGLER